jgi:hypothetical protein
MRLEGLGGGITGITATSVRERNIPPERPQLIGEVSANF